MTDTGDRWWLVAGWVALVLPRNDGVVWALLVLAVLWVLHPRAPLELWARCSSAQRAVAAVSTAVAVAWAVLVGSDLVPIPGGGTGTTLLTKVVGRTGEHLREAVGVLGWLDTPIPETAQLLWWVGLGLLVAPLVLHGRSRRLRAVGAVAVAVVVVPWVLEFVQGRTAGLFWQGRYSLPLFVGAALLAGADRELDRTGAARLARAVASVAVAVWSLGYLQLLRRFGVGIDGSLAPWRWDTWSAPVSPMVLAPVFVAAAVTLRAAVTRTWPLGEAVAQSGQRVEHRKEQRA